MTKYILSCSFGKDSVASVILAHLHGEPIDYILNSEVMYDISRNISGENPIHIKFIKEVAKPKFEEWGYKVEILHADTDYLSCFNRRIEHPRKYPEHKGMKFGFPLNNRCYCLRDLKMPPIDDFVNSLGGEVYSYVGIAADEKDRLETLYKDDHAISLLDKYGYTETMAKELCKEYGLLSPIYDIVSDFGKSQNRQGCWFCPNAKLAEIKTFKKLYPEIWEEFVELENQPNVANNSWNIYGNTLARMNALSNIEQITFQSLGLLP